MLTPLFQIKYSSDKLDEQKVYDALKAKIINFDNLGKSVSDTQIMFFEIPADYVSYKDPDMQAADYSFRDVIDILLELDADCQLKGNYIDDEEVYLYASTEENVYYDMENKKCPKCGSDRINKNCTFDNLQPEVMCDECGEKYIPEYADKSKLK